MTVAESFVAELDVEVDKTRRCLARIPTEKLEFTPHAKSFTMSKLAAHIATIPDWASMTMTTDHFDFMVDGKDMQMPVPESGEDLVRILEKSAADAKAKIAAASDDEFDKTWKLLASGETVLAMSKRAVLREMIFNHLVHHRGQLTVYMRLNDIPVPALYGPSADES